jgi:translation initiation factor 3 subunit L
VDLSRKSPVTRLAQSYVAVHYYMAFSYLMLGRYTDTINALNSVLAFVSRTHVPISKEQQEVVAKKSEQMYGLLALAVTLSPHRVDEHVYTTLRDKLSEKMTRMARGEEAAFEELYTYAVPRFVITDPTSSQEEPYKYQLRMFLEEVRLEKPLVMIRQVLQLYSSISIAKLAALVDCEPSLVVRHLASLKIRGRQLQV